MLEELFDRRSDRREFLRDGLHNLTTAATGYALWQMFSSSEQAQAQSNLTFDYAKEHPQIRQAYLDNYLGEHEKEFPYINSLKYHENPLGLFLESSLAEAQESGGVIVRFIDFDRIRNAYAWIFTFPTEWGREEKSDVYVFGRAFNKLTPEEFRITMGHENIHGKDVFSGLQVDGVPVDVVQLSPKVFNAVMEVRGVYFELDELMTRAVTEGMSYAKKIRIPQFLDERYNEFGVHYTFLQEALKEPGFLTPYEQSVVQQHLKAFAKYTPENLQR